MSDAGHRIQLRSSARTNVGQVRQNNEDNVYLWVGDQTVLAVVADGMGGAAAGEEASRLAVEAIGQGMSLNQNENRDLLQSISDDQLTGHLRDSILQANLSIIRRAAEAPEMRGMGTTVTLAFVRGREVTIAHVGDSRAYHISGANAQIRQITSDHSFVEALFAAGHITREQADEHPMRNVLYRALGQTEDVDVDVYHSYLQVGDRLVLCSDGLTRHVKSDEIARVVLEETSPDNASQILIDMANERGGEDNVSVIVINVEQYRASDTGLNAQHADFTPEEPDLDEEDTLLFRDQLLNASTPPPSDRPVDALSIPPRPALRRSARRGKMDAERLSDARIDTDRQESTGAETLPDRGTLGKSLPPYPKALYNQGQSCCWPYPASPGFMPGEYRDGDGGRA
jgi:serine/threonine protein phosphatase PrpC